MDAKLTLKLDGNVIKMAKSYAKKKNTSLSKLIESYLSFITASGKTDGDDITPLVKSLSGVKDLPKNYGHKKSYNDRIMKKYSKQ